MIHTPDTIARFETKYTKGPGCWLWQGSKGGAYGYFKLASYHQTQAHRVAYELRHGPIADGYHIDHVCRTTLCVNPDHLEAVSCRTNILRGVSPWAANARKVLCKHGHDDWVARADKPGRRCLTCLKEASARQAARRKQARRCP